MTVRMEVLGDDGEWHEVPGIASVELHQEQPDEPPDDAYWRRHDALDSLHYMTTALAEARRPRVIDQNGHPVRPNRPAWQSPYGPPPRRR
ncbi:hypothetical protein ABZ690_28225 [Streptomyces sp. NPDC006967]|uniref:hypothetical protein n=1 Tax=Streptomyces sp. NPDC006967 TaxID=3156906 RepID=UPI0033E0BF3C